MLRLIKLLFLGVILLFLVTMALGNREPITLQLLPGTLGDAVGFNLGVTLPGFLMVLAIFSIGLLFGFVWEWLREAKHRAIARVEQRERQRLEEEVRKVAPPSKTGDDVLAILDGN